MDREQKQVIERLENIIYLYNRESRGWHDCNDIRLNSNDIKAIEKAIEIVKAIPSAEPKTGHWILQPSNKEQGERDFIWWKCSECGQVIYSETEKDRREYHAFCGRCGKRMVEPQESEVNNG